MPPEEGLDPLAPLRSRVNHPGEIACPPGWTPLILELDQKLSQLDPNYEIFQIKEKFGGLRFYAGCKAGTIGFFEEISKAEEKADQVCSVCGQPGKLRDDLSWILVLCTQDYRRKLREQRQKAKELQAKLKTFG